MLIWIILFYLANLLDILTTYLCMRGKSKEEMAEHELNPIMSPFIHNKKISYAYKFGISTAVVVAVIFHPGFLFFLSLLTILLFLVTGNNILAHYMTKMGMLSPGKFLTKKLKLPKILAFFILIGVFTFAALGIWMVLP